MSSSFQTLQALGISVVLLTGLVAVPTAVNQVQAGEAKPEAAHGIKLESLLVWGTNDDKSPNPEHKIVDSALKKKFEAMPLKYKNYFEVKRTSFSIGTNEYTRVEIDNVKMDVKDLGASRVKFKFYAKNGELRRQEQPLPNGETLIFGGDDKNDNSQSAWFIVIRHPVGSKASINPVLPPSVPAAKPATPPAK